MSHFNLALFTQRFRAATYGYTFREVAEETGVSAPTLSRLKHGSMPDVATLYALCAWMQVSPGVFLVPAADTAAPDVRLLRDAMALIDRWIASQKAGGL